MQWCQALKWGKPDEAGLIEFLCGQKGLDELRVKNGIKRIEKAKSKGNQGRLDSFFKVSDKMPSKRPANAKSKGKGGKKQKTGPYANR